MFHRQSLLRYFLLPSGTPAFPILLSSRGLSFSCAAEATTTRREGRLLSPDELN
jgi:hypothetical protein